MGITSLPDYEILIFLSGFSHKYQGGSLHNDVGLPQAKINNHGVATPKVPHHQCYRGSQMNLSHRLCENYSKFGKQPTIRRILTD